MRSLLLILASALLCLTARAADECSEEHLDGPYGLQFSGETTISGTSAPAPGLARLVFDGEGSVTGYSSVNFNGVLLGNPVTGTYDVQSGCALSLSLQDDSGAWQHFAGKLSSDGAALRQTDPGAGVEGVLLKAPDSCTVTDFRSRYRVTISGVSTALATGGASKDVSGQGTLSTTGSDRFEFKIGSLSGDGTFEVQPDCIVNLEFDPPSQDTGPMKLRGILANSGKDILAIQTDPGQSVAARFRAQ